LTQSYTCDKCELEQLNSVKTNTTPCLILLTELASGDLSYWFDEQRRLLSRGDDVFYSCLFQIMAGLHSIQVHGQVRNYDIKKENVLFYNVTPGDYWCYIVHGKEFYVPNYGEVFILNDFGVSDTFSPDDRLTFGNYKSLGTRAFMVINNVISPIKSIYSYKENGKSIPPIQYEYGNYTTSGKWDVYSQQVVLSGKSIVKMDTHAILDNGFEFTRDQLNYLSAMNIDIGTVDFFRHPEIIPPVEFIGDTQDVLRIFAGGKQSTQAGQHRAPAVVPTLMKTLLSEYIQTYSPIFPNRILNKVESVLAGYFLDEFFTNKIDYRTLPQGSRIIQTYRIS
jgi:hypothetical protein